MATAGCIACGCGERVGRGEWIECCEWAEYAARVCHAAPIADIDAHLSHPAALARRATRLAHAAGLRGTGLRRHTAVRALRTRARTACGARDTRGAAATDPDTRTRSARMARHADRARHVATERGSALPATEPAARLRHDLRHDPRARALPHRAACLSAQMARIAGRTREAQDRARVVGPHP